MYTTIVLPNLITIIISLATLLVASWTRNSLSRAWHISNQYVIVDVLEVVIITVLISITKSYLIENIFGIEESVSCTTKFGCHSSSDSVPLFAGMYAFVRAIS